MLLLPGGASLTSKNLPGFHAKQRDAPGGVRARRAQERTHAEEVLQLLFVGDTRWNFDRPGRRGEKGKVIRPEGTMKKEVLL